MSLGAKIAVSAMRGIKKTSLIKGPSADLDAELRKAKKYNWKHPYARLCESQNRGVKAVRILIFGAGVIGSLYGALLAEAGYEVSVYARGRRLESMSQDGLLVKNGDTDDLADKINYLIEHPDLRQQMGSAAYKNVARFSEEEVFKRYLAFYKSL